MALVVESIASSGWSTGTSWVTPKPTGLAVGDYMILLGAIPNGSITAPSGFSAISTGEVAASGGAKRLMSYYKLADSGDVAASNFTTTNGSSAYGNVAILRVSGIFAPVSKWSWAGTGTTNTTSPSLNASITPSNRPNNLIIQFWCASQTVTALSGYAMATSNPSWTEILDSYDVTADDVIGIAYATRTEQTATGNVSVTGAGASGTSDWTVIQIAIAPADFTITESTTLTESYRYSFARVVRDTVSLVEDITSGLVTLWTNTAKNVSSWINQDK